MIALITGATSGIGKATAQRMARDGYDLILTGRRNRQLEETRKLIQETADIHILTLCFDVRKQEEVEHFLGQLPADWQSVDVLVNNAGLAAGLSPVNNGVLEDWEQMIDTNIKGLLYVTRVISPLMIRNGKGHIVNIGSIAGKEVYENGNVYCATKHAVDALTKAMRIDLLKHGIKVSSVNPGAVETEFSIVRFKGDQERAKAVYKGYEPLHAEDIADAIQYILSRPPHVTINDMLIMPTAQANATQFNRK
ncbi:MAG: SDR family NAD(P)-dependent oxidoreductase [Bacteroidales bacterium]